MCGSPPPVSATATEFPCRKPFRAINVSWTGALWDGEVADVGVAAGRGKGGGHVGGGDGDKGWVDGRSVGPAWWNDLPADEAERELISCCASRAWARAVTAARPYASVDALLLAATDVLGALPWADVEDALRAHPRIGQRLGDAGRGEAREMVWSRQEQAGAAGAEDATATALVSANQAYEERFGHVFLIFATGRTAEEMLAAARVRLGNDEATERVVVRHELVKITRLRLERLLEGGPGP